MANSVFDVWALREARRHRSTIKNLTAETD